MTAQEWKGFAPDAPADLVPSGYGISGVYDAAPVLKISANADIRLRDAIEGKISLDTAERDYGVVIRCRTPAGDRISLPDDFAIDRQATAALRARMTEAREPLLS